MSASIRLAGLLKIELADRTVLLCDGGFVKWGDDTYRSRDALFGVLAGADVGEEGTGDEAPSGTLVFLPPPDIARADLLDPSHQGKRMRFWVAEIDEATGLPVGEPDQQGDMLIDAMRLVPDEGEEMLEVDYVSHLNRIFEIDRGNSLSSSFHVKIFPGELGLDGAAGVTTVFAWGVVSAPRGIVSGGMGGIPAKFTWQDGISYA